MFRRVCVAGTFNRLHDGHLALLSRAFEVGEKVFVGLTCDSLAAFGRATEVRRFSERKSALKRFLDSRFPDRAYRILKLKDELGPAASGDYDAIVVSTETRPNAERINQARLERGLDPLEIVEIPMVLASDGRPITATRIVSREFDERGRVQGNA
jgi:pantetheine-phosphate adenylyltransferase